VGPGQLLTIGISAPALNDYLQVRVIHVASGEVLVDAWVRALNLSGFYSPKLGVYAPNTGFGGFSRLAETTYIEADGDAVNIVVDQTGATGSPHVQTTITGFLWSASGAAWSLLRQLEIDVAAVGSDVSAGNSDLTSILNAVISTFPPN
jgi:hypothetical protein